MDRSLAQGLTTSALHRDICPSQGGRQTASNRAYFERPPLLDLMDPSDERATVVARRRRLAFLKVSWMAWPKLQAVPRKAWSRVQGMRGIISSFYRRMRTCSTL
jgi:hypothetical protein